MNKEILRDVILTTTASVFPDGLRVETVLHFVSASGFPALDKATLDAELAYLAQENLLLREPSPYARGVVYWKLAAAGRRYLEEKGLL